MIAVRILGWMFVFPLALALIGSTWMQLVPTEKDPEIHLDTWAVGMVISGLATALFCWIQGWLP